MATYTIEFYFLYRQPRIIVVWIRRTNLDFSISEYNRIFKPFLGRKLAHYLNPFLKNISSPSFPQFQVLTLGVLLNELILIPEISEIVARQFPIILQNLRILSLCLSE